MGILRRSEFLRCVPLAVWGVACGQPAREGAQTTASGGSGSAGTADAGSSSTAAGAGAAAQSPTGGQPAATGGHGGAPTPKNKGGAGAGGSTAGGVCPADVGARATAQDFSMNSDTGELDGHVLSMSEGDIIRRILQYTSSGEADHKHEIWFTNDQLVALLAGESVVVETQGPPLNAATGHTHTITVHPCTA